ncbi:SDR family NAD(P)-dependent oxidoreductase [Singulisphaera sp. PoT]|uniref:SDR family NAD(P)-dependent oxidoreductase n=1 Tax=Singulisphaera sp. PoT TaxID=3411797 RepID=UPI003BF4C009
MSSQEPAVLITGGRRVGSALAKRLASRGSRIALTYHTSREAIERTVGEINEAGGLATSVAADLSRADEAERAVAHVVEQFGRIDHLVNMASVYRRTPFSRLKPADFDDMIAANLAGPYHTSMAAARRMQGQEARDGIQGRIINFGDWATDRPYKNYLPYLIAKGGLATMTLALAKELAPTILVNLIQPAMIEPPSDFSQDDCDAVVAQTPLARVGTPEDVIGLVLYLLEGTTFATGSCIRVDGGRFLGVD